MERRGVFVLDGDVLHALLAFIMRALFAYVVGGDGGGVGRMAGNGLMSVARVIVGSAPGVLAHVLCR